MGYTDIKLDRAIIYDADDNVKKFLDEWTNNNDFIYAHTSGSTGMPKKIHLAKKDMEKSAFATCNYFGITENSTLVLPLSPDFIAGKMMIVRAIVSGAKLFIEKPSNNPIKQDYGKIDLIPIVPSQINSVIESSFSSNIRNIIIGGGAIPKDVELKILNSGINCFASYGMTETCSHVALRHIVNGIDIYESLSGFTFSVDNRQCLVIYAPDFSFNKIITNDIVELLDNTHFKWIGRWDNVINSGGIKIYPEEIEKMLSEIIVDPFYITATPDDKWGEVVTLYVENNQINIHELELNIKQKLTNRFYYPKKIIPVEKFDRTSTGKIIRTKF